MGDLLAYHGSQLGFLLKGIETSDEQAYIQKHPYLNGPDIGLNHVLRGKTRRQWTPVQIPDMGEILVHSLEAPHFGISSDLLKDRQNRPPEDPLAWHAPYSAYAWKVHQLPAQASSILSIGCGTAIEIGAMRCLEKGKDIHAVDFRQAFPDQVQKLFDFKFECGHWLDYVRRHPGRFDAAFSNHCMEHVYNDPTGALRMIGESLRPGGAYVFAMPIEMSVSNPYSRFYSFLHQRWIYPWMLDAVDCGHPWKADLPELKWRLLEAGFSKVEFFFRGKGVPYANVESDPLFDRGFEDSWKTSTVQKDHAHPSSISQRVLDWCYELNYRVKSRFRWNHLKNENTTEVLVRAVK